MSKAKKSPVKTIKFIKSPTGAFGLGYNVGDETKIEQELAETLVLSKFAVYPEDLIASTEEVVTEEVVTEEEVAEEEVAEEEVAEEGEE